MKYPRTEGVYKEWIAAIKNGGQPGSNFAGHAGPLTEMITLGNLAVRAGRTAGADPTPARSAQPDPERMDDAGLPLWWSL
ncbi:MAG: hypothetical protein U0163_21480 [Gemmatimonadaceae bacterium]